MNIHSLLTKTLALTMGVFAAITLFMSASVLFDWFGSREQEGNYVLFVVVCNFVAGFLYLVSVYGLLNHNSQTTQWLLGTCIMLMVCLCALLFHIYYGGLYEQKTIYAMIFRIAISGMFTLASYFLLLNKNKV